MRFGIDVDGVIASFTNAFVHTVNTIWPGRLPINYEPTDWDWGNSGLSKAELDKVYQRIHDTPNFWMYLYPYNDNVNAIARHRAEYKMDEIYYVTARRDTLGMPTMHQTQEWLRMCGIYGLGTGVIVDYGGDKVPIFMALQCEATIDDKLSAVVEHDRKTKGAYLLSRPWNERERPSGLRVVHSLAEFFEAARGGSKHAAV